MVKINQIKIPIHFPSYCLAKLSSHTTPQKCRGLSYVALMKMVVFRHTSITFLTILNNSSAIHVLYKSEIT